MDSVLRFSDYDVFAYVVSGFAAILSVDLVTGTHLVIDARWTVAEGIVLLIAAYVAGQILAAPASWLIERKLVRSLLGRPVQVLMGDMPNGWCAKLGQAILPEYYRPLDRINACRLAILMDQEGLAPGEDLFWRAFPAVKANEIAYSRVEAFHKLHGFCRNLAFVAFIAAVALAGSAAFVAGRAGPEAAFRSGSWALIALLISLGMLQRYLKFRRLYVVEVLTTFADTLSTPSANWPGHHTAAGLDPSGSERVRTAPAER